MTREISTADDHTPGFHYFQGAPGNTEGGAEEQFYWHLISNNGRVLCVSEAYTTAEHASEGIDAAERTFAAVAADAGQFVFDRDKLRTLIHEAAGAGTRPLLEDHPDYVFPSDRVAASIEELLAKTHPLLALAPPAEPDPDAPKGGETIEPDADAAAEAEPEA